ncbi:MAG TPA: 23S rRNA (adenine(2503)-C(2))-methyltransferase RlmN [Anaerolineaceae bacterium]|nr:23S rRNA (adenine(2503)-C(2))-methyltransferase RlmN [Anaerolineaceae bacterium]
MPKTIIYDLTTQELEDQLCSLRQPNFRVKQIQQGIYNKLYASFDEFENIPKDLRAKLDDLFLINPISVEQTLKSRDGNTEKVLFKCLDGSLIETVLMRFERRNSVCISTQVGCPMGCVFCSTGQMGFQRNLSSGEILAQVVYFQRLMHAEGEAVRNIVYMGMGEPFLNYEQVSKSLDALTDPERLGIGSRKITVSSVGVLPKIAKFGTDHPQVNLAISLHAPNDELRSQLLPANRIYPLHALMKTCREYVEATHRKLTFEYALIDQVNDTPEHAQEFADLVQGMLCIVNLIALNPSKDYPTPGSSREKVEAFRQILVDNGVQVTVRLRRGIEIKAGCGQLASPENFK